MWRTSPKSAGFRLLPNAAIRRVMPISLAFRLAGVCFFGHPLSSGASAFLAVGFPLIEMGPIGVNKFSSFRYGWVRTLLCTARPGCHSQKPVKAFFLDFLERRPQCPCLRELYRCFIRRFKYCPCQPFPCLLLLEH